MKPESKYLKGIRKLNKISTSAVCRDFNINFRNLISNRSTLENEQKVYIELIKRIDGVKGE